MGAESRFNFYDMETIYWIQRFGAINSVAWITFTISVIVIMILAIIILIDSSLATYDYEYDRIKPFVKALKKLLIPCAVSLMVGVFVPSESQLYVIYGVGGTIDYIRSNDTAKQLPDKVMDALDAWVDKQVNDQNPQQ